MSKSAENLRNMARHGDVDGVRELLAALKRRAESKSPATNSSGKPKRTKLERVIASMDEMSGNTALHLCCANGHTDIAVQLIEAGAPVSAINTSGSTPLHYASLTGQLEVVKHLVRADADLVKRNNFGNTPLDEAVQCNHKETADFLVDAVEARAAEEEGSATLDELNQANGE